TLRIDRSRVTVWNGPYRQAREGWESAEATARSDLERLKLEERKAKRTLVEQRQINDLKRSAFRKRNNTTSFKDIDGRSAARQNKHREGEKAAGKILSSTARQAERATEAVASVGVHKTVGGEITFDHAPSPKRILATHNGPLTANGTVIAEKV